MAYDPLDVYHTPPLRIKSSLEPTVYHVSHTYINPNGVPVMVWSYKPSSVEGNHFLIVNELWLEVWDKQIVPHRTKILFPTKQPLDTSMYLQGSVF